MWYNKWKIQFIMITNFNNFINEGCLNIFKKKSETIKNDNEKILKLIYDNEPELHKYYFFTKSWVRNGDLIPSEKRNDEIITSFDGIDVKFDTVTKIYEITIAPKYDEKFSRRVLNLIDENYDTLHHNLYKSFISTKSILFKEMSEERRIELDTKKYNL